MVYSSFLACGVAHQALDAINPKGDDILIQGILLCSYLIYILPIFKDVDQLVCLLLGWQK